MQRREFLRFITAATAAGAYPAARSEAASSGKSHPRRFLLSNNGCGRATGYAETNKIVTVGDRTHVAWLDSVKEGFRVRIRTLDRATGTWSPTYTIGEAFDNHGGPALTVDGKGYLHVVYYPHHHPFRYRRSTRPNDASQWEDEIRFGKRCSYPTLVCGPDDTLYLTCRESDVDPWVVNLYTKRPGGDWQKPIAILRSEERGYSHFQEALAWSPDHRTLHLSSRFYDGKPGRGHTVGYLRGDDFGKTWRRLDGTPVPLPATAKTVSIVASERDKPQPGLRCGAIAVDSDNRPAVLYSSTARLPSQAWLAFPDKSGKWNRRSLNDCIAKKWPGRGLTVPGGLWLGDSGKRIGVVLTLIQPPDGKSKTVWGHPSSEIVWLESTDAGKSFEATMLSPPDPTIPNWLPNIERPTGRNRVASPGLIYTAGTRGKDNRQIVANEVYWVGL